jgi:hypothetical protein
MLSTLKYNDGQARGQVGLPGNHPMLCFKSPRELQLLSIRDVEAAPRQ